MCVTIIQNEKENKRFHCIVKSHKTSKDGGYLTCFTNTVMKSEYKIDGLFCAVEDQYE